MKEIPLTLGLVATVDDADYLWLMQWKWHVHPSRGKYYAARNIRPGVRIKMHQALLPCVPKIDHRNGDGLDNQRHNLRPCTGTQNQANARLRADSRTGFKGVSVVAPGRSWRARIKCAGHREHLGVFSSPIEAAAAYDEAAKIKFGEFAKLNFPQ